MKVQNSQKQLLPPWPSEFPRLLGMSAVAEEAVGYSTEEFLSGRRSNEVFAGGPQRWADRVEKSGPRTKAFLGKVGLIADEGEVEAYASDSLDAAQAMFNSTPWCKSSIDCLTRSIVVVKSSGSDYDCSHSDPSIPFSVFFSVPLGSDEVSTLRLCESILHETMHLQLTLFEQMVPLISEAGEFRKAFSPWRGEPRLLRGILHGTYVFHVIRHWYLELLSRSPRSSASITFMGRRSAEISGELSQLRNIYREAGFTESGRELIHRLIGSTDQGEWATN